MNGKILTISIAAYNMESYIRHTLDSLVSDRVINDLEIFVVDDGGSDSTLKIAQEYAARYPDSIIPVHKENGGYGTTVNYSIARATGKYFKLLDGDDWFDAYGLEKLILLLREAEEDVIVNTYYVGADENELRLVERFVHEDRPITKVTEIGKRSMDMWSLAYKTKLLKNAGLQLPAHMLYTDRIFSTVPFANADSIRFYNFPVYCYRIGRDGQSVGRNARIKHKEDTLQVSRILCGFYEKHKNCVGAEYVRQRAAVCYLTAVRTILLDRISADNLAVLKEFDQQIKTLSPEVFSFAPEAGITGPIMTIFRRTKYWAYWLFLFVPKRMIDFRFQTTSANLVRKPQNNMALLSTKVK